MDSTAAVAYIDLQFNYIWANGQYERLCGHAVGELAGRNFFKIHSSTEYRAAFMRVMDKGIPEKLPAPIDLPSAQQETGLFCIVAPLKNRLGNLYGLAVSIAHETQRLPAADVRHSATEIEAFVSVMTDGIALFDADGNAHLVNEAAQQMLEVGQRVLRKDWPSATVYPTEEGTALPLEQLPSSRALRGETIVDARCRLITRSGREFVANISAAPVINNHGGVVGATVVFRDISDMVAFEEKRREVYEREHRIAEILQQALIPPQVYYNIGRCGIVVKYQPALDEAAVGGDFYDIFEMDDGRIGVLIGDVAGKGLPAAIRVAAARYSIRSYAFLDPSPSVVMTLANQVLCREEAEEIGLLTAFFAMVDVQTGVITYSNGGHEPPLLLTADGRVEELELQGGGLGFYDGFIYAEACLHLHSGDAIVMVTDGITEARSPNGDFFDKSGLMRCLAENHHKDLDSLAQGIVDAARAHAHGNLQDDAAVVVMKMTEDNAELRVSPSEPQD
ncbi:MAG: SpoIIE family protein phosphatase [Armatimonadota bacterium]|nr:SpoIIE family protein phosphatase [bacterium]